MLLDVSNLTIEFRADDGIVKAVRGIDFKVDRGETLGIVGESGSGKSVANLSLLGLIPKPPGRIVAGKAMFDGKDLLTLPAKEMQKIRGRRIAMIFQDPMTALNPFLTIAEQLSEVTRLHLNHTAKQALHHAIDMLEKVGIPKASTRIFEYPHQFSGGMRQRVMIAMALSCQPDLLIADEPTTALDVTIQAQILDLMNNLQHEFGAGIIMITHDLGVVAKVCDRVNVMYAGRIVEAASVDELFDKPRHPYTLGLLESVPRVDTLVSERLTPIAGQPPDMTAIPSGCAFHPRCPFAIECCLKEDPALAEREPGRRFACHLNIDVAPRHEVTT